MNDGVKGKLWRLPGTKLTPTLMLHQLLETVDAIDGLVVVIRGRDGFYTPAWTSMELGDLVISKDALVELVREQLMENRDDWSFEG